jgi:hypothetical protein
VKLFRPSLHGVCSIHGSRHLLERTACLVRMCILYSLKPLYLINLIKINIKLNISNANILRNYIFSCVPSCVRWAGEPFDFPLASGSRGCPGNSGYKIPTEENGKSELDFDSKKSWRVFKERNCTSAAPTHPIKRVLLPNDKFPFSTVGEPCLTQKKFLVVHHSATFLKTKEVNHKVIHGKIKRAVRQLHPSHPKKNPHLPATAAFPVPLMRQPCSSAQKKQAANHSTYIEHTKLEMCKVKHIEQNKLPILVSASQSHDLPAS